MGNVQILEVGAWCYGTALFQHCDPLAKGLDVDGYNYIFQQATFVRCYAKECVGFLENEGVKDIDYKHLQYFFSIEPPVYRPYMNLWLFCFDRMKEEAMLPPNAEQTLNRFLKDKRSQRYLNLSL